MIPQKWIVLGEEPVQLKHKTGLSKVLSSEELAVVKVTTKLLKTSAHVLISSENMKILEEKEKKKQEEAEEKKKRKIAAEEKCKEKEKVQRLTSHHHTHYLAGKLNA